MNIIWQGETFFRISTQKDKNSNIELVVEPSNEDIKSQKIKADIIIEKDGEEAKIEGDHFVISKPGEYEIGGVFIQRVSYAKEKSFYLIEAEGIKICHLGNYNQKEIETDHLDLMSQTDILMIPVGGGETLDSKEAAKLIAQIEPKIIIPMNYKIPGSKEKIASVQEFLKVMGIDSQEEMAKLSIKAKDLLEREGTEVVVLKPENRK